MLPTKMSDSQQSGLDSAALWVKNLRLAFFFTAAQGEPIILVNVSVHGHNKANA